MESLVSPFSRRRDTADVDSALLVSSSSCDIGRKEGLTRRHGGPGGGVASTDTVYFDPKVYRIVLFDQRGAGKSEPYVLHVWHRYAMS